LTVVQLAELIIAKTPIIFRKFKDFPALLKAMPITYGDLGEQTVFMLYLTYALTKYLSWESPTTLRKLGLSCILHDCKLDYTELSLIRNEKDKKLKEFSIEELTSFKNHALAASKVASEFTNFPDCSFIIREHHVLPEKRYTQNMSSISCIFAISRRLTTELTHSGFTSVGLSHSLPELRPYASGNFRVTFDALIKILVN